MGGIAIIGLGKGYDRNEAPLKSYTDLNSALGGSRGRQSLTRRFIIINAAGETASYSTQLHTQFSPAQIAAHINKGGIWIDYTGWPMYYQADAQGTVTTLGQSGWSAFVNDLGPGPSHYGWLDKISFAVPEGTIHGFTNYRFVRGFPLDESLDGVCYSTASFSLPDAIGSFQASASGFASLVSIHPPNGGYYFYGTWTPARDTVFNADRQGVPIDVFANFIQQVLRGNTTGLTCQPYKTNYQKPPPTSTGQSSPTQVGSTPGPSGSKSSAKSGKSTTPKTTTKPGAGGTCPAGYRRVGNVCVSTSPAPSGLPAWVAPAGVVAGVAGILGTSAVLLIREHHRHG